MYIKLIEILCYMVIDITVEVSDYTFSKTTVELSHNVAPNTGVRISHYATANITLTSRRLPECSPPVCVCEY